MVTGIGIENAITSPIHILTDSASARLLAISPVNIQNKYSRHIEQRIHWFRELVRKKELVILHIPGNLNPSDCFTKCLGKKKFNECSQVLLHGDDRNLLSKISINKALVGIFESKTELYEMLLSVLDEKDTVDRFECDSNLHIHDSK